ncbi:hypothetical protein IT157_06295 [bacterium]|nr:hypothetical protein [bacterium]
MSKSIEQKKADRFLCLRAAYEATEGRSPRFFNIWEIGASLGLPREETRDVFEYLKGEYLVEPKFGGGGFMITHAGVVEIEEALTHPNEKTEHFPPFSLIVNTGTIINQSVRGDNNVVSATSEISAATKDELPKLLTEMRSDIAVIAEEVETQTLLLRRIDETMSELGKSSVDSGKVEKLLQGIKQLLKFAGGAVAEGWLQKLVGLN